MVVLSEKLEAMLPPPPSYYSSESPPNDTNIPPPPFPGHFVSHKVTFSSLPSYILLHIIHQTLSQEDSPDIHSVYGCGEGDSKLERQRKVLYWMSVSLRLVSRNVYIACMHVLRSTYLPAYSSNIRFPYSSDPFPFSSTNNSLGASSSTNLPSPLNPIHRETAILDLFLALKVREDVWADDTEFHLGRGESFRDLFELMQPKARLEDLIGEILATGTGAGDDQNSNPSTPTFSSSDNAHHTPDIPDFFPFTTSKPKAIPVLVGSSGNSLVSSIRRALTPSSKHKSTLENGKEFLSSLLPTPYHLTPSSTPHSNPSPSSSPAKHSSSSIPISFSNLSISFSPRRVGLLLSISTSSSSSSFPSLNDVIGNTSGGGKRTIVEVPRERDERLEVAAERIARELTELMRA